MAWSIFQQPNGQGHALLFAYDLLHGIRAPINPETLAFIYSWEVREGGGGKYNPLNQGPYKGLSTTGEQYGGGAADYASFKDGVRGSVAYLNMPNFEGIRNALQEGNVPAARTALIESPWAASHYGGNIVITPVPETAVRQAADIVGLQGRVNGNQSTRIQGAGKRNLGNAGEITTGDKSTSWIMNQLSKVAVWGLNTTTSTVGGVGAVGKDVAKAGGIASAIGKAFAPTNLMRLLFGGLSFIFLFMGFYFISKGVKDAES